MTRFKSPYLVLMLGMTIPVSGFATDYCIKVNGGWGNGGSSFIGKNFTLPGSGVCKPWSGFVKTATSVIAVSVGTACKSTDGKILELSINSTNPSYLGTGVISNDHMKFCPGGTSSCPIGGGFAVGTLSGGSPSPQTCTTNLIKYPYNHS